MELYLLLCAVVLLLCIFSNKISDKIGVPSLLIFMFLGMVFGSEGIFKIEFSDFQAAENICTAALIFIMFYGGYSTNWEHARPAAGRAAVLSTLGVGIGAAVGIAGPKIIRKFRFCTDGFDAVFVLAAALTSYALAGILGGNGFLSVYLTGILMGNAKTKNKANVVRFFDNVTILAQIATFFLIGLLSYPSQMVSSLPATLVIILFLTLAARPAMVFILTGRYLKFREKIFVSFAGLRGASSIVFAIFASAGGVYMQSNVFYIVFGLSLM
ncbi:cation:proton antiporter [Anaerostipes faecis]|uniref:cation:proton antiporter domain-containing protein n=1 Tax=Anaerostipes faecis TaxID=2880702 RepID=UPI002658A784|nr:cation:proton antiporter [Anaerostipes faecis]